MVRNNKFPQEGGMMLYRGLVRDQVNSSRSQTMIQKRLPSSERERSRVLEILSLLPDAKQKHPGSLNHERYQLERESKGKFKKTIVAAPVKSASSTPQIHKSIHGPSPYQVKPKMSRRYKSRTSHRKIATKEERKVTKRLLPRDHEYIWHPVVVEGGKNKKTEVVLDVMKHYQSQYHKTGARE